MFYKLSVSDKVKEKKSDNEMNVRLRKPDIQRLEISVPGVDLTWISLITTKKPWSVSSSKL